MNWLWMVPVIFGTGLFVIGAVVGSFLNVCIYRIPWEKSVVWPDSRCPNCLESIQARDNIPILGWLLLGRSCRSCGSPISARYPSVELLVGILYATTYFVDTEFAYSYGMTQFTLFFRLFCHLILISAMVAIAFIDIDYTIVPREITTPAILFGLLSGVIDPKVRPDPSEALTRWGGLWEGLLGVIVAIALVGSIRVLGAIIFRREAMGAGDIDILAMIGAFLGWEIAVLSFFLGAFYGLIPAIIKLVKLIAKRVAGRQWNESDRELPYGPMLTLAALTFMLTWHRLWPGFLKGIFASYGEVISYLITGNP